MGLQDLIVGGTCNFNKNIGAEQGSLYPFLPVRPLAKLFLKGKVGFYTLVVEPFTYLFLRPWPGIDGIPVYFAGCFFRTLNILCIPDSFHDTKHFLSTGLRLNPKITVLEGSLIKSFATEGSLGSTQVTQSYTPPSLRFGGRRE